MKFVLFNIAVVAALFVLFSPDSADLRALSDRAAATVDHARNAVENAISGERDTARGNAGKSVAAAPDTAKPVTEKTPPRRVVPPAVAEKPVAVEETDIAPKPPAQDQQVEPLPKPGTNPIRTADSGRTAVAPKTSKQAAEPALDPAVAKRRAEVLGLAPVPTAEVTPAAGDRLMSAEQRRRELFTLAEEMELFYVKRLSR